MNDAIYNLTPKQYKEQYTRNVMAEYGVTRAEAEGCGDCDREHFHACREQAEKGEPLRREVLDAIGPEGRFRLFHDWPTFADRMAASGYLAPEVRKEQAAHKARMIAARKRGAAAARGA